MFKNKRNQRWIRVTLLLTLLVLAVPTTFAADPPVQTYYVPLPEDDLLNDTFDFIGNDASSPITSIISIAIAADGTIIYYDHWEDGYDSDVTNLPGGSTTAVWGDMDVSNGAPPGVLNNSDDVLESGDAYVLENTVAIPRDASTILFDARDRIQASFPIAVTRGAYPNGAGSLMAGAVEVLEVESYGTEFIAPVGEDTLSSNDEPFEITQLYVMAEQDNTRIFLNSSLQGTLNQGESLTVNDVDEGDVLTADKPVQVDLITGDIFSLYELRWYSLIPRADWSNDYYSPVAEETAETGFWIYNPNNSSITVTYVGYDDTTSGTFTGTFNVTANSSEFVTVEEFGGDINIPPFGTPGYTGLRFFTTGGEAFFIIAQVDTINSEKVYDWGFPLIPADQLTSQALIGWGYGNTTNNPSITSFSVVWVTPVSDADIFVDFDGDGTVDQTFDNVDQLEAILITDVSDNDMTGALIYATDQTGSLNNPVNIAVAWGQDPGRTSATGTDQPNSLDLGTVIPALPIIAAGKTAELINDVDNDGQADPGDSLRYTIAVVNAGKVNLAANTLTIVDNLPADTTYVPNSTTYNDGTTTTNISDDGSGTAFPLDGAGLDNISVLEADETHMITFDVVIDSIANLTPGTVSIINSGQVNGGPDDPPTFETITPLDFDPAIEIQKTVTLGHDSGASFGSSVELVQGGNGANVTYYFEVTNTGTTYLDSPDLDDNDLDIDSNDVTVLSGSTPLAPAESIVYYYETTINGDLTNTAIITGNPTFNGGTDIDIDGDGETDDDNVTDNDTAAVDEIQFGSIEIVKEATPEDGTDFEFSSNVPGFSSFTLDDEPTQANDGVEQSIALDNIPVGEYAFTETLPSGWQLDSASCTGGNDTGTLTNQTLSVEVGQDEDVVCTFENSKLGSLTILKTVTVGDTSTEFDFKFDDGNAEDNFKLKHNELRSYSNLSPGDYDITEVVPAGWDLNSVVCDTEAENYTAIEDGVTVNLPAGEEIECTFTNIRRPDLTATKTNDTNDSVAVFSSFNWTITVANQDGAAATFTDGQVILQDDLPTTADYGTPSVGSTVNVTNDSNIACSITTNTLTCAANGGNVILGTNSSFAVTIPTTPTDGDTISNPADNGVCTVDPAGLVGESDETNNTCADTVDVIGRDIVFNKIVEGGSASASDFTLDIGDFPQLQGVPFGTYFLPAGDYIVTENGPVGYVASAGGDDDETNICSTGTNANEIDLSVDLNFDFFTCTITNEFQGGSLTIVKNTPHDRLDDETSFTFSSDIANGNSFSLTIPSVNDRISFNDIPADTYNITETLPDGWRLDEASCTGGTDTGTLNNETLTVAVGLDENITCTFTNSAFGTIRIIKDTMPDNGQDFEFLGSRNDPDQDFSFMLDDDDDDTLSNTYELIDVSIGRYFFQEIPDTNYLTALTCIDPNDSTDVIGDRVVFFMQVTARTKKIKI
ncbi:MAG: hypothetical protein AAF629_29190 [Chloroflexota bacterium]